MNMTAAVQRLVPSLPNLGNIAEGNKNFVRAAWDRLHTLPGGKRIFSTMIGRAAPYTGTIGARVVELEHGRSKVELTDRKAVRNHLRSVHAVALVNLAELTGNVAVAYSLPDDARFIVAGLEIDYIKKARGTITGVCDVDVPATSERHEMPVVVEMLDASGEIVARAILRTLIGPKKRN